MFCENTVPRFRIIVICLVPIECRNFVPEDNQFSGIFSIQNTKIIHKQALIRVNFMLKVDSDNTNCLSFLDGKINLSQ